MRIISSLNTYQRLLLLILATSGLFFILFCSLYFYTIKQEKQVYNAASKEYENEVNSIFTLNSKTHIAAIVDVTFWDELVTFLKTKDEKWYKEYVQSQFPTYDADFIGVYTLNNQLIRKTTSKKLESIGELPQGVINKLYKDKLVRYYKKVPQGILEVFGATIHPSSDLHKNKFKPSGYFFMARILGSDFIKNLEKITSSKIKIVQEFKVNEADKDAIYVNLNLNDLQNETVSNIVFERPFHLNFITSKKILITIIIATIINLLVYLYYYRKWVYRPIDLITNILETKDEKSINNLRNIRGEFIHISNLFEENNNQRKELEIAKQKAEEGDKLKSSFLANLSHEIRTPMNAIMGFSDLLIDPNLGIKDRNEYLKIIRNSGKNLTSIIEDLLEMSKIDSKLITPNYKAIDLEKCIYELYNSIKITVPEEKDLQFLIQESLSKPKTKVLTDEVKLKQILTNLVTNALKFTITGTVSIGYYVNEQAETIEFWVKDTGQGIEKDNIQIIFDRFRRIEDKFSVQVSGLGLGLSITKAYVELLGGTINVDSTVGKGSKFSFSIPLKYDETKLNMNVKEEAQKSEIITNQTILIAEDDDINFMLLQRILLLKNYNILRAVNGKVAVDTCKENPNIDLIFMDIKMPIMDGFEAFSIIRTFNQTIPIIANTAYSSTEDKEKILSEGFTNYISKPINKVEIFEMLDELFGSK
ncbi:ATP-binding protein [Pedobacter frigiditerrae]|uniref:ATP-binding protein n=1 Tax=Pedobacter frigiditerrae TaxID=2530452 RepID=UPI00293072DA|nr:ATP-binding protein [Pedobacter frigiditerrae]